MDALMERVLNEKIKILKARLETAVAQRDRFANSCHEVRKIPHQERHEIMRDCDEEIERAGRCENLGNND